MNLNRRELLRSSAVGLTAFLVPPGLARVASASTTAPVLVALYLRGGADGLDLVPPIADPLYYEARPTIQVPPGTELALDGFFGLNPALAPLQPLYQSGDLCILHACGSPDPTRSHFDAQDFMERAAPGNKSILDGWLNRYLLVSSQGASISGISLSSARAKALAGPAPSLAFSSIRGFRLGGAFRNERRAALEDRYAQIPGTLIGSSVLDAFSAIDLVATANTDTTVEYPSGSLARRLRDAAALIKADIGARVITVDTGGWDHHSGQLGRMENVAGGLAAALAAFHEDLGDCANTTLTLCMTEFGRRRDENGAAGTDHGHGGVMMAVGGGIAGQRVLCKDVGGSGVPTPSGRWPGLAEENLDAGKDLVTSIDFRDIFAEALVRHMGLSQAEAGPVFPGFGVTAANFPGLYV